MNSGSKVCLPSFVILGVCGRHRRYVQLTAATVRDEATLKRELASLQQINGQYPKYILTLDEDPDALY